MITENSKTVILLSFLIILNYKTYDEATGVNAVEMAKLCLGVSDSTGISIVVAPQFPDIYRVADQVGIPVYAQHMDGVGAGSNTGHIYAKCISEAGACGTLLNHSEKRMNLADIEKAIQSAKEYNLKTVVCTNNVQTTAAASALNPTYVAIEPPELIGSGIPVSKANPEIILNSVKAVRKINKDVGILCGAGISKGDDLKAAKDLGADGVLLASGIIRSKDPKKALENLVGLI